MTVRNYVAGAPASGHSVQFFDTDESRVERVALFLAHGYRCGEALIVIGRPPVWSGIRNQLTSLGVPVEQAIAARRLLVLDAADVLRRISPGDHLASGLFEGVLGARVRDAARGRAVRVYGAMVDILAQRGDFASAIALETHWNALLRELPMKLLCGYCSAHFVPCESQPEMSAICAAHDRVEMESHDQLGVWLLGNVGVQPSLG